jgi:hypothetical protein
MEEKELQQPARRTEEEIKKMQEFYERLPSDAFREELLAIMKRSNDMTGDELDVCLKDFYARIVAAMPTAQIIPFPRGAVKHSIH